MKARTTLGCGIAMAAGGFGALGFAEKPQVDGVFPAGGQRGSEFTATVTGKIEPWPLQAVCDDGRILLVPSEKDKGKYSVKVPPEVEPGPCLVRFFNAEGATAPRQFVISGSPERMQSGSETMEVPSGDLPLIVNGKLDSGGEVDRFAFELEVGQMLVADVRAYALDSPLDPLLHVRGPRGEQLAFNHDATRLGLDPRLVFRAPAAGRYELHLSAFAYPPRADIRFTGSATSIYRLTFAHDPPTIDLPPPHESDGDDPQPVEIPASISGRLETPGDVDRFQFAAKKGETLRLEVEAAKLGSWMDAVLVIKDAAGKELKRVDDIDGNHQPDVAVDWGAPADGDFIAEVHDLNGRGGSEICYRFTVSKPVPSYEATTAGGVYSVRAGEKAEIAVKVARRYGYEGELEVGIEGLPAGVTAAVVAVSDKGEAKLSLEATAEAVPTNVPVTIWAAPKGAPDKRVPCRLEVKGASTDAGDLLINETERGWLTVLAKK